MNPLPESPLEAGHVSVERLHCTTRPALVMAVRLIKPSTQSNISCALAQAARLAIIIIIISSLPVRSRLKVRSGLEVVGHLPYLLCQPWNSE